jgi:hypothetical protein
LTNRFDIFHEIIQGKLAAAQTSAAAFSIYRRQIISNLAKKCSSNSKNQVGENSLVSVLFRREELPHFCTVNKRKHKWKRNWTEIIDQQIRYLS